MGKFQHLVDSLALVEEFKQNYSMPWRVNLRYCPPERILTARREGEVVIPMIAFIKGGMTRPVGSITLNYLHNHKLSPEHSAPNTFRILRAINALNKQLGLGLT